MSADVVQELARGNDSVGRSPRQRPLRSVPSESLLTNANAVEFEYDSIKEAFPDVDPGLKPLGAIVLLQVRHPKRVTSKGVILVQESRSTEHYNTQVAKVIALGALCFKTVTTVDRGLNIEPKFITVDYVEGRWFDIGDFVRIPKFGGDRFEVPFQRTEMQVDPETNRREPVTQADNVVFALFKAKDILGVITADPTKVKAYLD